MRKNIAVLVIIVVLIAIAVIQNGFGSDKSAATSREEAAKVDFKAPVLSLEGLDGAEYQLGGPKDKAVLINFWASWCGPCEEEVPDLVKLQDEYEDDLVVYAVNVTDYDLMPDVKAFVNKYKMDFPVLLDRKGAAQKAYDVLGYPMSYFVDKEGVIREIFPGIRPYKEMERAVRSVID